MSTSLVRRALELFEEDCKPSGKKSQKNLKNISTQRHGLKRLNRPTLSATAAAKNQPSVKDRKVASALDKYRKKHKKEDHTATNLAALASFDKSFSAITSLDKIVERFHQNKLPSRSESLKTKETKKKESTVFTEEDFAQFEKEYFVKV